MSKQQLARNRRQNRRALFEALESRTHFDLVPTSVTGVPASLIATVPTTDAVTVNLENTGSKAISGAYTVKLFASANQALDGSDTQITSVAETLSSLAAGKSKAISVKIGSFPYVTGGKYYVLAEVTGSLAGSNDNVAASSSQVTITDPNIDLTDSVAFKGTTSVKAGGSATAAVVVTNNGNVTASGALAITLDYSANSNGSSPSLWYTENVTLNAAAGKSQTFDFTCTVASDTAPGACYMVAVVDPGNTFDESNTAANRTAVTPAALTVSSPYPNVLGTFTGTSTDTSGPDKGKTNAIAMNITSESQTTGEFYGTGGGGSTMSGTITAGGAVTLTVHDSDGSITNVTGTFAGGKMTGKWTSGSDAGNVTMTLSPDLYPSIVGTFTGTSNITGGPDKGGSATVRMDITTESQTTGAFSGTESDSGGGHQTISGTITAGGAVSALLTDIGDSGTSSFSGSFYDGTLAGTWTNSQGDSGTITSTLSLDSYPDIVGTFTGTANITAGKDKGQSPTVTWHVTSESQTTGDFSGTESDSNGGNQTISGTITTGGAVSGILTDIGDSGTTTYTGTFANGILTGTWSASKGDSGNVTLSLS
jgi:hypothetical protein